MYRALIPALAALTACGGDDDPTPRMDASVVATIDARADAMANLCPTLTSCPCFSNYDCADGYKCVSHDDSGEMVSCIVGTRGAGALNAACTTEADCASALCVETDTGKFCSDVCDEANSMCTGELPDCTFIAGPDVAICTP